MSAPVQKIQKQNTSLVIGTRASVLALWQAQHVAARIKKNLGYKVTLHEITTRGDLILDRSLAEIGGKGLFLKEIEEALLEKKVDLAVHSLKDVPFAIPEGLTLAAILPRDDARDAWIAKDGKTLPEQTTEGFRVGTTSLRRSVQLKEKFPQLHILPLRGNVGTRLKKMENGDFDAIVLAMAGLKRLGLENKITTPLETVPAVGQGAIAIECRSADTKLIAALRSALNDAKTETEVTLEREFMRAVEGSCQTPIGCHAQIQQNGDIRVEAFLAHPDGSNPRFFSATAPQKEWPEIFTKWLRNV